MHALSEESKQLLNTCPECQTVVDVTECAPYSKVACPDCDTAMRVRRQFQHYEINAEIGEGGMSRVFRANDPSLGRQVALKILLDQFSQDDERVAQFEKEARLTASFSHPNVVKLYAVGRDQGYFFLVMELIENGNLDEWIAKEGKATERQALTWALETAHGLQAAYQSGLIHRDIKPGNILLSQDRSAKLVDFGLALMVDRDRDESGEIWATPYYVPPEKLRREAEDLRSDIYSLGGTLYHLLVGKPPIEVQQNTYEELVQLKAKPIQVAATAPHLSEATSALVERMMAHAREGRHASYEELIAEIETCLEGLDSSKHVAGAAASGVRERFLAKQREQRKRSQKRLRIILGALTSLALAGICLWALPKFNQSRNPQTTPTSGTQSGFVVEEDRGDQSVSEAYLDGRRALLMGEHALAALAFQEVQIAPNVNPSIRGWAIYNQGLAHLLDGKPDEARKSFLEFENDAQDGDQRLQAFFRHVSGWMTSDEVIPETVAETVQPGFCQSIALLAYGLQNWQLGAFSEASVHFARFQRVDPGTDFDWIKEYRSLMQPHQEDWALLESILNQEINEDLTALKRQREDIALARDQARTSGARRALDQRLADIDAQVSGMTAAAQAAEDAKEAQLAGGELSKLRTVMQAVADLGPKMEFDAALRQLDIQTESFESRKAKVAAAEVRAQWQGAKSFVSDLLESLPGSQGTVHLAGERMISGEIVSADRSGLKVKRAAGAMSIPMSDLTAGSLARLGLQQLNATRDSNVYYQRKEQLVLFAHCTGLSKFTTRQATALARENRPFRERWERLQVLMGSEPRP